MDDDTRKREFGNLESIKDNYLLPHPPLPPISPQEYRRRNGRGEKSIRSFVVEDIYSKICFVYIFFISLQLICNY